MATTRLPYEVTKNGSIYVRLVIPPALLAFAEGKKAIWRRLGASRREAKANHARALASAQDELDAIRARKAEAEGVIRLDAARRYLPKTVDQIARDHYAEELWHDLAAREHPNRDEITDMAWARPARLRFLRAVASGNATNEEMDAHVGWAIDEAQRRGNHTFEVGSREWRALAMKIARAELEVHERAAERNTGDFDGAPRMAELNAVEPEPPETITFKEIIDEEVKRRTSGKDARGVRDHTIRQFRRAAESFASHRKNDNAVTVTATEGEAWIAHLLAEGRLAAKTIGVTLVDVRTILNWGRKRFPGKFPLANPLQDVEKPVGETVAPEERTFTMEEARTILKAAQRETSPKFRFIPWMTAYSGARVGEIAQLRPEDFFQIGEDWFFRITNQGGRSVKTSSSIRRVPVHRDLIARGLIEFVQAAPAGESLFGTSVQPRISEWMRDTVKLQREYMAPNHSWRHLFEDLCTLGGVIDDARSYMTGRSTRSSRERYGRSEVALPGLAREMAKVPSILAP